MGNILTTAILAVALILSACVDANAEESQSHFTASDLPPEPQPKAPKLSLYDALAVGTASPHGTNVDAISAGDLFAEADGFLHGTNGHPMDAKEAAFWLRRAILVAPDEKGRRRAWAMNQLGRLMMISSSEPEAEHIIALNLWEIAAAWNDPDALCNLGELSERGDKASGIAPNKEMAIAWYERAKNAGCARAAASIARLK